MYLNSRFEIEGNGYGYGAIMYSNRNFEIEGNGYGNSAFHLFEQ